MEENASDLNKGVQYSSPPLDVYFQIDQLHFKSLFLFLFGDLTVAAAHVTENCCQIPGFVK